MAWMPMCGQTWLDAAVSFLSMWVVMMVAMMLPSLLPTLWRCRQIVGTTGTAVVAVGYVLVWTICGLLCVYPLVVGLSTVELHAPWLARMEPIATGLVILSAGALQLTAWKAHHLACCRPASVIAGNAWRHGLRLGLHCVCCCAGATASLLAIGLMDLRAMVAVTAAITAERLIPDGARAARAIGTVAIAAGLVLTAHGAGLG
jgi:predicted metal-binding membrane protein